MKKLYGFFDRKVGDFFLLWPMSEKKFTMRSEKSVVLSNTQMSYLLFTFPKYVVDTNPIFKVRKKIGRNHCSKPLSSTRSTR